VAGWYEHKECFNKYYEVMMIENPAGEKRDLIVQRVEEVEWLGGGGSIPVHRKVSKDGKWKTLDMSGVSWDGWNVMRAEVFPDRLEFYAGRRGGQLKHQLTVNENVYTTQPYFGTIATTQERPKAVARYEFFEVIPLDN
jgi:NADH:ubiquinone oxidoreductase subunit